MKKGKIIKLAIPVLLILMIGTAFKISNIVVRSDEFRIRKTEHLLRERYWKGFTYKGIDYYDGEKYYLFSLNKTPEIVVRANYETTLEHTIIAFILYFEIGSPVYNNYSQKVTEYMMNKQQTEPVDISDMTKKQAEIEILNYYSFIINDEVEKKYKTDLAPEFEIVAIYKGQRIYFDNLGSESILEDLTDLGLPD